MLTLGLALAPLFQLYLLTTMMAHLYNQSYLAEMNGAGYEGVNGTAVG